jgi:DNA-binding HxlR family transcriptional regulator
MKSNDSTAIYCPIETTLGVLGGKWKTVILWHLREDGRRFLELQRLMPGVTRKMLAQQLRELERAGTVKRRVYDQLPLKVEYTLTTHGKTLRPVLRELGKWGLKHRTKQKRKRRPEAVSLVAGFGDGASSQQSKSG